MTQQDAAAWAGNRAIPEGVVAYIADSREWTRHYQIKFALARNPKVPLRAALRFLPHLLPKDLKALSMSRDVSPVLARQAKALLTMRTDGRSH